MRTVHFIAICFGIAVFMAVFLGLRHFMPESWAGGTALILSLNVGWAIVDWRLMVKTYAESAVATLKLFFGKTYVYELGREDSFVGLTFLVRTAVVLMAPPLTAYVLFWLQPNLNFGVGQAMDDYLTPWLGDDLVTVGQFANFLIVMVMIMFLWLLPIGAHDHGWGPSAVSSRERMVYTGWVVLGTVAALTIGAPLVMVVIVAFVCALALVMAALVLLVIYGTMHLALMNAFATTTAGIIVGDLVAWSQMAETNDFNLVMVFLFASAAGGAAGWLYHHLSKLLVPIIQPHAGKVF